MQASTMILLLFLNCLFSAIALGIGFVAGGWFLAGKQRKKSTNSGTVSQGLTQDVERSLLASSRLRDLAANLALDVNEHSSRVEQITNDLQSVNSGDAETAFYRAVAQVAAANEQLRQRLEKAEEQIQAQAEEIRVHETQARTDSLTELANRRAFDIEIDRRFSEWQRNKTPVSLAIVDIDHFKKFNDTHGHQAGDQVLRQAAATLAKAVREMDLACRYGGEEFAVVLPNTDAESAGQVAERARKALEKLAVTCGGKTLSVTGSIGVAEAKNAETSMQLLRHADEALYRGKQAGRNCTYLFDGTDYFPVTKGIVTPAKQKSSVPPASPLESLPNRTLFAEELRRRVAESHRLAHPLAVLVVDVVGFNGFKRECGNAAAHMTLEMIAEFLSKTLREMDLLGRLEDNRFAIMLPGSSEEQSRLVGERARNALVDCTVPIGEDRPELAIRVGAATVQADDTASRLIERAEATLDRTSSDIREIELAMV